MRTNGIFKYAKVKKNVGLQAIISQSKTNLFQKVTNFEEEPLSNDIIEGNLSLIC